MIAKSLLFLGSICLSLALMAQTPAFPGAEGFGKYTTGGRGGRIVKVTNLNDAGPGSFRAAAEASGPRIIVFDVSGTIHLLTRLYIKGDVTIAGQTAPGGGICLADQPVGFGGNNMIIRYLRVRMGDRFQRGGMVDGNGGDDALGGTRRSHIVIDHCSMSWSTDEVFSVYGGDSTTLSWNLIAEPLNYSYHFEDGDKDYEHHGFGGIWGGRHTSAHHNLFAHCNNRTPRFDGIRNIPEELVDFRNNVIYNWGENNAYAGEGGHYNMVNNYYKPGPSTHPAVRGQILNPYKLEPRIPFGKFYVTGNFDEGDPALIIDNWKGVKMNKGNDQDKINARVDQPFAFMDVKTETAARAFEAVMREVGAVLPARDTMDQRIIQDVKKGRGKLVDVQGDYPHGTAYEATVNAWPALKQGTALKDSDNDGMPDAWEKKNHLNPSDPGDAVRIDSSTGYAMIEIYINSLH